MSTNLKNQKGVMLMEVLLAISAAAVVITVSAQMVYVGIVSNRSSTEKNVALGLAEEISAAVEASSTEKWQNVYNLTKGTTNYYPQQSAGKWVLTAGTQNVTLNGVVYTRSLTIQNVCRNTTTRNITGITDTSGSTTTCTTSTGGHDPSTQQISINVTWPNGGALTTNKYITRWRNLTCLQTAWSSTGSGTSTCPATIYESQTNITPGADLQLCNGGC